MSEFQKSQQSTFTRRQKPRLSDTQLAADMGKLPPQAVDVEEVVIGAIMLIKGAFDKAYPILKSPDCFYKQSNQDIFSAIIDLHKENWPIDIMTVIQKLKKNGKLDEVGGPFYVSQLVNRVSSSENIEFHARIVVEKHLQREVIRISSEMAKSSYEDTADVLSIIERLIKDSEGLRAVNLTTSEVINETTKSDTEDLLMTFNGNIFLTTGNISGMVAPPGTGKSNVCEAIVAACVASKFKKNIDSLGFGADIWGKEVLFIDTERSKNDSIKGWRRLRARCESIGNEKEMLAPDGSIRGVYYENFKKIAHKNDRRTKLEALLSSMRFKIAIIDGIADFVSGVNDEEGSVEFLGWLCAMADKFQLGIFITIHDNPSIGKTKPRGHLGSEFYRKAEGMLLLAKVPNGVEEQRKLTTNFEFGKMRNASNSNELHFTWDTEKGMFLTLAEQPHISAPVSETAKKIGKSEETVLEMLNEFIDIYDNSGGYTMLEIDLKNRLSKKNYSRSKIYSRIKTMKDTGYLIEEAKGVLELVLPQSIKAPF